MSAKSDALEQAVTDYFQAWTALEALPGTRRRTSGERVGRALADMTRHAALRKPY